MIPPELADNYNTTELIPPELVGTTRICSIPQELCSAIGRSPSEFWFCFTVVRPFVHSNFASRSEGRGFKDVVECWFCFTVGRYPFFNLRFYFTVGRSFVKLAFLLHGGKVTFPYLGFASRSGGPLPNLVLFHGWEIVCFFLGFWFCYTIGRPLRNFIFPRQTTRKEQQTKKKKKRKKKQNTTKTKKKQTKHKYEAGKEDTLRLGSGAFAFVFLCVCVSV